jgi:predicted transcriptional regulator YheO
MGLFFNVLPDRILAYKGETCHGGKHSKDRLTGLLCVNSVGSDKQVLIVIGKDMVPSFAETYEALEKVKAFFYAHSVTDADREHVLGLEKSYFQLRQNSAKKQKTMYDFFV